MTDNGVLVSRVVEEVYTLATSRYSLPFGLSKSSSREDIIEQLGDPDEIVKVDDGLGRVLRYHRHNVAFQLNKNRTTKWGIKIY